MLTLEPSSKKFNTNIGLAPSIHLLSALLVEINAKPISDNFFEPLEAIINRRIKEELQAVSGAREALSSLKFSKCVASSSSTQLLGSKLTCTGLFELFSRHIYSTEVVKHGKPDPDLFLHAASQLDVLPMVNSSVLACATNTNWCSSVSSNAQ